jgi:hypothetical protein
VFLNFWRLLVKRRSEHRAGGYVITTVLNDDDVIVGYELECEGEFIGSCKTMAAVESAIEKHKSDNKPEPPTQGGGMKPGGM